jgi:protein SSD1
MLFANMAVAKQIATAYPEAALLRRHQSPVSGALDNAIELLKKSGIDVNSETSQTLNSTLDLIPDERIRMLSRLLLIKSMKRADYFCTGSVSLDSFGHYALSVPLYTHFTSPIRRYCDLVVHRLLDASIRSLENPYQLQNIEKYAKQCNQRKNAAKDAQDASQHLYLCTYLNRIQESLQMTEGIAVKAVVYNIGSRSFDVVVPRYGIEGRVWIEDSITEGQAIGVQYDDENFELKVHWDSKTDYELIKMFKEVYVKVYCNIKVSPPRLKIYALPSAGNYQDVDKLLSIKGFKELVLPPEEEH